MTWTIWKSMGLGVLGAELILLAGVFVLSAVGYRPGSITLLAAMFIVFACIPVLAAIDLYTLR